MQEVNNTFKISFADSYASEFNSAVHTWSSFKNLFRKPEVGTKEGRCYVPADMPDGRRSQSVINTTSLIIFDLDSKDDSIISTEDIVDAVKSENVEAILHSTYSHTASHPRLRLICNISVPIDRDKHKQVLISVANKLGITASMDSACTDPARLFYFPRCPEERLSDYVYHYFDGSPVDVDSCLNNVESDSNLIPVPAFLQRQENQDTWPETEEHIAKVKDFLSYCPADCDYQIWRDICWAVCWLNWDCGEDLIRKWSQQSKHHWSDENAFQAEVELTNLLNSYDPHREKRITIGTLVNHAKDGGWKPRSPFEDIDSRDLDAFKDDFEPPFKIYDRSALNQLPPMEWLVDGIVPSQGVAAIYGESGCGKTFLALDLAASISQGKSNWFGFDIKQRDVVYMALEGRSGIANRLEAWDLENGQKASNLITLLGNFNLNNKNHVEAYLQLIDGVVNKGAVTFVDTLSQASPGTEENNSKDIGILLNAAKQIAAQTEGVVIIIHHSGKDKRKGLRGHSSMNAAMDLCIEVKKDSVRHDWHTSKVKDGDGNISKSFILAEHVLKKKKSKKKVLSCAVREVNAKKNVKSPKGSNQKPIYEALKAKLENQNILPANEVLEVAKNALPDCPQSRQHTRAKEALKELVVNGYFNMTDNGSYSLPET